MGGDSDPDTAIRWARVPELGGHWPGEMETPNEVRHRDEMSTSFA